MLVEDLVCNYGAELTGVGCRTFRQF